MQEIKVFFTTLALRSTVTMLFMAKGERCLERGGGSSTQWIWGFVFKCS